MTLILLTLLVLAKPHPGLTPGVARPLTVQQICATKWRQAAEQVARVIVERTRR